MRHRNKAFSVVNFMVTLAVLGLVIAVSGPAFLRNRAISHARICQENLAVIDAARERYLLDHKDADAASIAIADLVTTSSKFGPLPRVPVCPDGGTYDLTPGGQPHCSIAENPGARYAPHTFGAAIPHVR